MWPEYYGLELWGSNLKPTEIDGMIFLILLIVLVIVLGNGWWVGTDKENGQS